MIGSEGLKGKIRNIANSKNLRSQEVLQMFFFERSWGRRYRYNGSWDMSGPGDRKAVGLSFGGSDRR